MDPAIQITIDPGTFAIVLLAIVAAIAIAAALALHGLD